MTHKNNTKELPQPPLLHIQGNENRVLKTCEKHIKSNKSMGYLNFLQNSKKKKKLKVNGHFIIKIFCGSRSSISVPWRL